MPETPQRPFVPRQTPSESRPMAENSDFFLARPFVPGARSLPSIGEFLAPPHEEVFDELPPIEHFTDPAPPVTMSAPDFDDLASVNGTESGYPQADAESAPEEGGWIEDDWQQYDWRAAAALGEGTASEASNEWARTDWEVSAPVTRERKPSAAEAIASALDQIAQRIREGELAVPSPETLSNPAAIAASLAALLGVKR